MDNRIHITIPFSVPFALVEDLEAALKKHAPNHPWTIDICNEDWPEFMGARIQYVKDQPNGQ